MTRGGARRVGFAAFCLAAALLFAGLGFWQVQRLGWKRDLIARVEARVTAPPVAVPPRADWSRLDPAAFEYRRVRVSGRFDHSRATLVDALTERGAGFWLLTPLDTGNGIIFVNRGLVPRNWRVMRSPTDELGGEAIIGLIRVTEPGGRFLRPNRPAEERWYSRDVTAIAQARGLADTAPFFIDAEADPRQKDVHPIGGLTVVRFRDNHLVYALTWFALAALALWGLFLTLRTSAKRG